MNEPMIRGENSGDVLILTLAIDHLDAGNSASFRTQVGPLAQSALKVVFDLTGVRFIDSAGLGVMLSLVRNLGERGGELRVCCVAKPIQVLFELVRLHKILNIHGTRAEAIAALEQA